MSDGSACAERCADTHDLPFSDHDCGKHSPSRDRSPKSRRVGSPDMVPESEAQESADEPPTANMTFVGRKFDEMFGPPEEASEAPSSQLSPEEIACIAPLFDGATVSSLAKEQRELVIEVSSQTQHDEVIVVGPPCNTFSSARASTDAGEGSQQDLQSSDALS